MNLLEVVMSLFVMTVVLLGLDATQLTSLRAMKFAIYYAEALQQLRVIQERLQLKTSDVNGIIANWNKQNQVLLPRGRGEISGSYPHYTITLYWQDDQGYCDVSNEEGTRCLRIYL